MTLIFSERALPTLERGACDSLTVDRSGSHELAIPTSDAGSRGYKRVINLRHGLNLLIRDYWLHSELVEDLLPQASGLELEFGFNLLEESLSGDRSRSAPSSFLQFGQTRTRTEFQEWQSQRRILKIDLHLTTRSHVSTFEADQMEVIPAELRQAIANSDEYWFQPLGAITSAAQLVLQQILSCPYQGSIQQIYLEAKALELIALQSAQLLDSSEPKRSYRLKPSDVERVHHAKALLARQLENPPSLLDLARAVGLNDCTLKRGFRQVFGTTVFGYVRQQRLKKARQLLSNSEMSVADVACAVGYSHPGYFAAAFKREFGTSPKRFSSSSL